MADLEKVIKGLECHCTHESCDDCPYDDRNAQPICLCRLMTDALELLKERQPRVMTLDEIREAGDDNALFIEYMLPTEIKLRPAIFQPENSDAEYMCVVSAWLTSGFYSCKTYGKNWRCWTARPTDEQREAVKWE